MLNPVATVDMERVRYFRMSLRLFLSIDHQGCWDTLNSEVEFGQPSCDADCYSCTQKCSDDGEEQADKVKWFPCLD